ncbi:3-(3-hydroxyphenyl)propionate 2-hydroxylase [Fusarium denticulatum]|uniref:3-(3-hydroxyphenyl)propionate 2-hydroxylase n=1 Tax=Fusarium denticulatum TaxID=48507 RepID=A0A8H5U4K3_9HYPO|nr:3-(3-hydroxyphenyl)propionate 2-hydroxylase [Fusarium denticulatum]
MPDQTVIVVGAGPVGLFTALILAQKGIKVTVIEASEGISRSPRACVQLPCVNLEFAKAGVIDEIFEYGCRSGHGYCWRDGYDTSKVLADFTPPPSDNPNLCAAMIGQDVLAQIFLKHLINTGNAEVIFNHAFTRVEDHGDSVTVHARRILDDQELSFNCRYVVGADGGKSAVRKSIGQSLEGHTWPDIRLIAVNILYDLEKLGWKHGNFIVHPEDWAIVVKRGPKNLWRVATSVPFAQGADGEPITDKAVFPVIKDRLERILPGNTDEIIYLQTAPYTIHQRCVSKYRVGNIMLAGDAAHLNNPVGGLGLTTGLLDAAHLGKALIQVINENAPETALDEYANARLDVFKNVTDPLSTANLLRVKSTAPEDVATREAFFKMLNDPNEKGQVFAHMAKEMGLSTTLDMKDLGPRPQL